MNALPLPIVLLSAGAALLLAAGIAAAIVNAHDRRRDRVRRCIYCGCTDEHSCPEGCWWFSYRPPICSRCA